jgi:hypothetical protein
MKLMDSKSWTLYMWRRKIEHHRLVPVGSSAVMYFTGKARTLPAYFRQERCAVGDIAGR